MAAFFANPMGVCKFDFVELASLLLNVLEHILDSFKFTFFAKHRSKIVVHHRQGGMDFIVNRRLNYGEKFQEGTFNSRFRSLEGSQIRRGLLDIEVAATP
jgi:4-hydroxyphenylpyruvate dioxygenase-like putative hemolysin